MGEARKEALRVGFDSQIKLEFHGAAVTSDAGLVAYRELDEALGLTAMADDLFRDPRRGMNTQHEKLKDIKVRKAIQRAIDVKSILDAAYGGTAPLAHGVVQLGITGNRAASKYSYNPDEAKKLWAQADAISPWSGSFQIAYNSDGGHQTWVDAVTNSIKNTLGIDASGNPYADFASLRKDVTSRTIETAFRTGWQADYPGLYNFLGPLYATNAGSNDGDYSNPEFDKLLDEGISASDADTGNADFQKAQEILLKDLPATPLWYSNVTGGFAEGVQNVEFGWNSVPLYYLITK